MPTRAARILRPLVAIQVRGYFKATNPRSARLLSWYFGVVYAFVFVVLGLGHVPVQARRVFEAQGPSRFFEFLGVLGLVGGVAVFLFSWLAFASEAHNQRTLETLATLRAPLRPAYSMFFWLILGSPLLLAAYFAAVFLLYLVPPGAASLAVGLTAAAAFFLILVAAAAVGVLVFLPFAVASKAVTAVAVILVAVVAGLGLVTYLYFPTLLPVGALARLLAGPAAADRVGVLIASPARSVAASGALALGLLALAYRAFISGAEDRAWGSGEPKAASRPLVSLAGALRRLSHLHLFFTLTAKDAAILGRNAGQFGLPVASACVFALLPATMALFGFAGRGSQALFLACVYFLGLGVHLAAVGCVEVAFAEGKGLWLCRGRKGVWDAAMLAKAAVLSGALLVVTGPVVIVYVVLLPAKAVGVLAAYVFFVCTGGVGVTLAAMGFGDFSVAPMRLSLPGRSVCLLGALGVATGALVTAVLAFALGAGVLLLALVVALLVLCVLAVWWRRAAQKLAQSDL